MKKVVLLASLILLTVSCSKDEVSYDPDNLLNGTWIFKRYDDSGLVFYRDVSFTDNHCYRFNSNGTLVERKNSGWCGTPPVSYADYDGTWSPVNDSVILINVGYWGGTSEYIVNILRVDADSLKITYEYQD